MEDILTSFCSNPYEVSREQKLELYTLFLKSTLPDSVKMLKEREKFLSVTNSLLYWSPKLLIYPIAYYGYSYFLSFAFKHRVIHHLIPATIISTLFYHDYRLRRLELYAAVEKNEHELISHYCIKHKRV
jgi:hypothetical protein